MVEEDPSAGWDSLEEASEAWAALGRPMDAARCEYLRGLRVRSSDPERSRKALESAAKSAEELGVHHLAELARSAVAG